MYLGLLSSRAQDYFGIYTEIYDVIDFVALNDGVGHLYVWNGFTSTTRDVLLGNNAINWAPNMGTWNGGAIQSDEAVDMSRFLDGYLHLGMKVSPESTEDFKIGLKDQSDNGWIVNFTASEEPYGFVRDGEWHRLVIPLLEFVPENAGGTDMSAETLQKTTIFFFLVGNVTVSLDEIYYSTSDELLELSTSSAFARTKTLSFFPNPAGNVLFIEGGNPGDRFLIYTTRGQQVDQSVLRNETLDLSHLEKGVYVVKLVSGESIRSGLLMKKQ